MGGWPHFLTVSGVALGKAEHQSKRQLSMSNLPKVSTYLGVIPTNVCEKLVNEAAHQGPGRINSRNELRYNLLFKKDTVMQHMRHGHNSGYSGLGLALVTCFGRFCWALKWFIPFSSLKETNENMKS